VECNCDWYLVGPGEEDEHPYQHGLHSLPGLLAGEGAKLWRRNEPCPQFRLKVVIFETLLSLINLTPNILKEQASDIGQKYLLCNACMAIFAKEVGLILREVCGIHNCPTFLNFYLSIIAPMATLLFTWLQQSFTMSIKGTNINMEMHSKTTRSAAY